MLAARMDMCTSDHLPSDKLVAHEHEPSLKQVGQRQLLNAIREEDESSHYIDRRTTRSSPIDHNSCSPLRGTSRKNEERTQHKAERTTTQPTQRWRFPFFPSYRVLSITQKDVERLESRVEEAGVSSGRKRLRRQRQAMRQIYASCRFLDSNLAAIEALEKVNQRIQDCEWFLKSTFMPVKDRNEHWDAQKNSAFTDEQTRLMKLEIRLRGIQLVLFKDEFSSDVSHHCKVPAVHRRLAWLWETAGANSGMAMLHIDEAIEWCSPQSSMSNQMCLHDRRQEEYITLRFKAALLARWQSFEDVITTLKQSRQVLERIELTSWCKPPKSARHRSTSHLHYHQEQCSVKLDIASAHAQIGDKESSLDVLQDCSKVNIPHLTTRGNFDSETMKRRPIMSTKLLSKISPSKLAPPLSLVKDDTICACVNASLGMLLLCSEKPQKAAVFLHKALELTWRVYNQTKDVEAKRLSRYLFRTLAKVTVDNEEKGTRTKSFDQQYERP